MTVFVIIYVVIVGLLYFYNRSLILADLIQFSTQYKGIQNTLLKELTVPLFNSGIIFWINFSLPSTISEKRSFFHKICPSSRMIA